jgi:hypothetical protein
MSTYTEVNYVVEFRVDDRPWRTWLNAGGDEQHARDACRTAQAGRRRRTEFRLVKRTAVITDEVLERPS